MQKPKTVQSQITFLYYHDLETIAGFYQDVLGLELIDDQKWAHIYRTSGNAYLGAVTGEKAFHQPQEHNAVLVTLVVDDVPAWYEHLKQHGVKMLSDLQQKSEIQIQCFFFQDPGGYTFEVQQFLNPRLAAIFHGPPQGQTSGFGREKRRCAGSPEPSDPTKSDSSPNRSTFLLTFHILYNIILMTRPLSG